MELRHLRYFVAIAEERSFTRAAERLWVAQPGLSTQIRRLETELGVRLFQRHTRGVDLTAAGELFLERARVALVAADAARCTGHDLETGIVGNVRLGLSTTASWRAAPRLLDAFASTRPAIELSVMESYGGSLVRELRDGRLDAVLAPAVFGSADLRGIPLGSEPWVVLVGRSHRLGVEGPLEAGELDGEEILITGHRDSVGYDRAVVDTLLGLGVTPVTRRGAPGPALLATVADGGGVVLTTRPGALDAELIARPLDPVLKLNFELLVREETPSPALSELIRTAEERAQDSYTDREPQLRAVA